MNEAIDRIHGVLPNTSSFEKARKIQRWIWNSALQNAFSVTKGGSDNP